VEHGGDLVAQQLGDSVNLFVTSAPLFLEVLSLLPDLTVNDTKIQP
jgi:hypothetical protein